ncbi:hypothetical protein ABN254_21695, partial [Providencia rettgeri]
MIDQGNSGRTTGNLTRVDSIQCKEKGREEIIRGEVLLAGKVDGITLEKIAKERKSSATGAVSWGTGTTNAEPGWVIFGTFLSKTIKEEATFNKRTRGD